MSRFGYPLERWRRGLAVLVTTACLAAFFASTTPVSAQECDKVGGTLGGAVIGGATGSLIGRGKGRTAAAIGGAVIGGALGSKRDEQAKARCLEEQEAAKDRDMQRQLDYERQRMLQEEQVRKEIEEQRLYEEWKRERMEPSG